MGSPFIFKSNATVFLDGSYKSSAFGCDINEFCGTITLILVKQLRINRDGSSSNIHFSLYRLSPTAPPTSDGNRILATFGLGDFNNRRKNSLIETTVIDLHPRSGQIIDRRNGSCLASLLNLLDGFHRLSLSLHRTGNAVNLALHRTGCHTNPILHWTCQLCPLQFLGIGGNCHQGSNNHKSKFFHTHVF